MLEYSLVHGISYYSCSYSCDGVSLLSILRLMGDIWSIRGMLLAGGTVIYSQKTLPSATSPSLTNPTHTAQGLNPDMPGERLVN